MFFLYRYFSLIFKKNVRKMESLCDRVSCSLVKRYEKRVQWKNFVCSYFKFVSLHFWAYLNQKKHSNFLFKSSNQLINEKYVLLNDDKDTRTVLNIGLNPENKFKIYARLEEQRTNNCFLLSLNELKKLLDKIENESDNILNENLIENSNIGKRLVVYENETECAEIVSFDDGRRISLDKPSLKRLIRMKKYILRYISKLEQEVVKSEQLFFTLLHNFCLDKTFNEACESAWSAAKYSFFDNFLNVKCKCTDENFTTEIATKCESWFGLCVLWYLRTQMLIESERLATFKLQWPHFFLRASVEEMAKCGLFFTGIADIVKCAFCEVTLDKWAYGDKPIKKHFEFSPKCPLLYDFRKTSNVSDIGEIAELEKLIALLAVDSDDDDELERQ